MRDYFLICLPFVNLTSFLISSYFYVKLSNREPKKTASNVLAWLSGICFFCSFFSFFDRGHSKEAFRAKLLIGYSSEIIEEDAGTPDYTYYFRYKSKDPREKTITEIIFWGVNLSTLLFPYFSFRWWSIISKVEDWEFKYYTDYKERLQAKKEQLQWYEKHPNWIKPERLRQKRNLDE